jgi:hypothetical protein
MKAILIFIDGTICDTRHRNYLFGTDEFYLDDNILKDAPTAGSVEFLSSLAATYSLVYIGARPERLMGITKRWLETTGFPHGNIYLADTQDKRLEIAASLKNQYNFVAGIGDRWDDNELHLELGCQSFILKEYNPNWSTVKKYLITP